MSGRGGWTRLAVMALVLGLWLLPVQAQEPPSSRLHALNQQVTELYEAGKFAEAIPIAQRALELAERQFGPDHPEVGTALNNLAELFRQQRRYVDAEALTERSLSIYEKALGPEHPSVATALNNLAGLYRYRERYADAERLLKRSLAITEKTQGRDHPDIGVVLTNLADLYEAQGRSGETETLYKRALVLTEGALGADHPNVAHSLNSLAGLYWSQNRYSEAEPLYKRVLKIRESALGPDHPDLGNILGNLTQFYASQSDWPAAMLTIERAASLYTRRGRRIVAHNIDARREVARATNYFRAYVAIANRADGDRQTRTERTFQLAQWALQSDAADALSSMTARLASGSGVLAELMRQQQDLSILRLTADARLVGAPVRRRHGREDSD
jgi:tetratricopeptide (TPR) repeat protein